MTMSALSSAPSTAATERSSEEAVQASPEAGAEHPGGVRAGGAGGPRTTAIEWWEGGARHRGFGEAWSVTLHGADRLNQLRDALASLWPTPACNGPAERVYGGLAFAVGGASAPPWAPFGDGRFTLPGRKLPPPRLEDRAADAEGPDETDGATSRRCFVEAVAALKGDIDRGEVDKVVLARRACVPLPRTAVAAEVVRRLAASFPDCATFAFEAGGHTFLGATPERLFRKRGRHVSTEALAGSMDVAVPDAAARLLGSRKERAEHAFVVHDIARRLAPLCESLHVAREPLIRALPHVLHLRTPIEGHLREGASAVDLIEALHPTPAVGGVPSEAALARIAALEPDARGWYSGPVGWIDARGDADICVALRSAVLSSDRAYLYAGAGIVAGSDPDAEWAETELKMRAIAAALGASR